MCVFSCVCVCVFVWVCISVCVYVCMYVYYMCVYVCMRVCVLYVYVRMYMCMCVCVWERESVLDKERKSVFVFRQNRCQPTSEATDYCQSVVNPIKLFHDWIPLKPKAMIAFFHATKIQFCSSLLQRFFHALVLFHNSKIFIVFLYFHEA